MQPRSNHSSQSAAVLTLSDIAAAIEAFNRGEANVHDVLDAIVVAIEMHRAASEHRRDAA